MKALAITKSFMTDKNGDQIVTINNNECNFDQSQIFSWTVIKDDNGVPDYIAMITTYGVSLEVEYDERVLSNLASEFRKRDVL